MCGIVGARHDWLLRRGIVPEQAMRAATTTLAWRGPDGRDCMQAGSWWLGCARLAISQPNSRQPVVRRGGKYVGVLNGAITNARTLWTELLPRAQRRVAPPNDAWLPLLAVEQQNGSALRRLRGHHAYAIVDTDTGELIFGQDPYGEKPFFCLVDRIDGAPALVAFASTPAALRALGMPIKVSPRRVAEWFRCGWSPMRTLRFDTRLRLEPMPGAGPFTTAANPSQWCAPWRSATPTPARSISRDDSGLRQRLIDSVAECIDTTVPVGLSLSGGLDSSCLAVALGQLRRQVPAYQLLAEAVHNGERAAARDISARAGLQLRTVDVGPEVLDHLPCLTTMAGSPLGDPSTLAVHAVARAAAADGVRVLLGGEGADELFLGYRRYRALAALPRLPWLSASAPRWSMHYLARWWRAVVAADPALVLLAVTPPAFASTVLAPDLASRRLQAAPTPHARPAGELHGRELALRAREHDLDGYLRCDLLPKVDVATMAAGVEARSPYLMLDDHALANWRDVGKRSLRRAFAADLPKSVRRLPKHGFALPLDRWFRGELPWLDLLAEPRTQQRSHLRRGGISKVLDLHRRRRADLGHGLYLLVAFELFLRTLDERRGISSSVRTDPPPRS